MKNIKYFAAAIALTTISFTSFAAQQVDAQQVDAQQARSLEQVGVVSASGATDIGTLEAKLAEKAEQAGASSYRIVAITGNDNLHGNAVLYK